MIVFFYCTCMIYATVNVSAIVADLCTRCRWPYHIRVGCYGSVMGGFMKSL